eukprot:862165-Pyramimonas_sp.AAC.1
MTFGGVPTRKGALQMTSANRLCPKLRVSISYLWLLALTAAHWSTMTTTWIQDFIFMKQRHRTEHTRHNWVSTFADHPVPKVHHAPAGFDQDMTRFEELAGAPTPGGTAREASDAEPPHDDGLLSTIYEGSEADLEPH